VVTPEPSFHAGFLILYVRLTAPLAWSTITQTVSADGPSKAQLADASPFPATMRTTLSLDRPAVRGGVGQEGCAHQSPASRFRAAQTLVLS
jgi:hypothetical protein